MKIGTIILFVVILECVIFFVGSAPQDHDKNIEKLITDYGYPLEVHHVATKDGYILELQRIPGNREEHNKKCVKDKPVILMMHGILCSSADWVVSGPNRSLAFLLAENGYDVWMGNNRGNTFSKVHISRSSSSIGYWNFSWHELGIYDLPAMIDYVLENTEKKDFTYVCFSQGCTQFFVMGSLKPEYNKKIKFVIGLAPAAFAKNLKGVTINFKQIINFVIEIFNEIGYFEFLPASSLLRIISNTFCKGETVTQNICFAIIFAFVGNGYDDIDRSLLFDILAYIPAGCSLKQLSHYWHSYENHGTFSQYDYGRLKNLQIYNSTIPPSYPLENIKVPIAVFHGINDYLATQEDIDILVKKLPSVVEKHLVTSKKYNHLDFLFGRTVKKLVYDRVLHLIEKYKNNRNY